MASARDPKISRFARDDAARVWLAGRWHSLGRWGSPEVAVRYRRLLDAWRADGCPTRADPEVVTVAALCADFYEHVARTRSAQAAYKVKLAVRDLLSSRLLPAGVGDSPLLASLPAGALKPAHVEDMRLAMVARGLSRGTVNERVSQVKDLYRWAARRELVESEVWWRLSSVRGLRAGECGTVDAPPIRPVSRSFVVDTLPFLSEVVGAMVRVNLETAAHRSASRPSET